MNTNSENIKFHVYSRNEHCYMGTVEARTEESALDKAYRHWGYVPGDCYYAIAEKGPGSAV